VAPQEYDWYLLSHAGLLGTSRPSHYTVLLDENQFQPDDLQQITFNLAWLYPRSLRS
jgi:eukaryotic translation initiation factor 2C